MISVCIALIAFSWSRVALILFSAIPILFSAITENKESPEYLPLESNESIESLPESSIPEPLPLEPGKSLGPRLLEPESLEPYEND